MILFIKAHPATATKKRPLYVHRKVLNADDLIEWAKSQGFRKTLKPDDLHVTQVYSKQPVDWHAAGDSFDRVKVAGGKRVVAPLGDAGAVVLKIESGDLSQRWQQFRDAGASWDYESYQPHVTISYDGAGMDLSKVEPYAGPIEFGPEVYEPLDEEWQKKVEETPTMAKAAAPLVLFLKAAKPEPTTTEPTSELIAEHERLVDVLNSPSHEDDEEEAEKQAKELAEYKREAKARG